MSLLSGITAQDALGVLNKGLDIEAQRQENKGANVAARLVAATQTTATPVGTNTEKAAPAFLERKVAGIPMWGLLAGGLVLGAAIAVYKR